MDDLRVVLRLAAGRSPEPSAAVLDSRTLCSSPESGGLAAWDCHKRTRGSKLHMAVSTVGHGLALHITPADQDDRTAVGELAAAMLAAADESVEVAFVGQGYISIPVSWFLNQSCKIYLSSCIFRTHD